MEKYITLVNQKTQYVKMQDLLKVICRFNLSLMKIPADYFLVLKFIQKFKRPRITKRVVNEKKKYWRA